MRRRLGQALSRGRRRKKAACARNRRRQIACTGRVRPRNRSGLDCSTARTRL